MLVILSWPHCVLMCSPFHEICTLFELCCVSMWHLSILYIRYNLELLHYLWCWHWHWPTIWGMQSNEGRISFISSCIYNQKRFQIAIVLDQGAKNGYSADRQQKYTQNRNINICKIYSKRNEWLLKMHNWQFGSSKEYIANWAPQKMEKTIKWLKKKWKRQNVRFHKYWKCDDF